MRPLIGITTNFIKDGAVAASVHLCGPDQSWQALATDYVEAVLKAGAIPVMIPVLSDLSAAKEMLSHLDGILFSGGGDISPLSYGESTMEQVGTISPERDLQEIALMHTALAIPNFPILCICRGAQLLNVALGGTLIQDIDTGKYGQHLLVSQRMSVLTHKIAKEPNMLIEQLMGDEKWVNSYHHQCIGQLGKGVKLSAHDEHEIPECIELPGRAGFTLGVQWHPEALFPISEGHANIFTEFVRNAEKYQIER